jgi:hypothetical protein
LRRCRLRQLSEYSFIEFTELAVLLSGNLDESQIAAVECSERCRQPVVAADACSSESCAFASSCVRPSSRVRRA